MNINLLQRGRLPPAFSCSLPTCQEYWHDVTFEEVGGHITRDWFLTLFEHLQVSGAHFRRYFVSNVKQLPETRVVFSTPGIVAQRVYVLF